MATLAMPLRRTTVFSVRERRTLSTAAVSQRTDVIGRRDRVSVAGAYNEPVNFTFELHVGAEEIPFVFEGSETTPPWWAKPVLESLVARWGVGQNWDGYHARATDPNAVARLLDTLWTAMPAEGTTTPIIIPLADGGVQAEWHKAGEDFEIVVAADEAPEFFYASEAAGEEEGVVEERQARVRELIERF